VGCAPPRCCAVSTASARACRAPAPPRAQVAPPSTFWVRVSRLVLVASYLAGAALAGVVIYNLVAYQGQYPKKVIAWSVGGIFVGASLPITLHNVALHLLHFVSPLQRFYIRILWMVPIYGVESWLSLRFHEQSVYLITLRELYEAFVIHAFFSLMLEYLSPDLEALKKRMVDEQGPTVKVCCCGTRLDYWKNGGQLIYRCQLGVYQYVFLKVLFALATFGCANTGCVGDGSFYDYTTLYPYSTIVINASQCYALWVLGIFYWELGHRVKWLNGIQPITKFLVVKVRAPHRARTHYAPRRARARALRAHSSASAR
jgi:hypothetical protein